MVRRYNTTASNTISSQPEKKPLTSHQLNISTGQSSLYPEILQLKICCMASAQLCPSSLRRRHSTSLQAQTTSQTNLEHVSYEVLEHGPKTFTLKIGNQVDPVSVDRLKAVIYVGKCLRQFLLHVVAVHRKKQRHQKDPAVDRGKILKRSHSDLHSSDGSLVFMYVGTPLMIGPFIR